MSHRNDVLSWLRIYPLNIRTLVEDSSNAAAQFIPISVVNSDPHRSTCLWIGQQLDYHLRTRETQKPLGASRDPFKWRDGYP